MVRACNGAGAGLRANSALIIVMLAPIESSAGPSGACAGSQVGAGLLRGRVKRGIRPVMQILPPLLGDILNGLGCHHGTLGNLCCRAAFFAGFVGWTSSGIT